MSTPPFSSTSSFAISNWTGLALSGAILIAEFITFLIYVGCKKHRGTGASQLEKSRGLVWGLCMAAEFALIVKYLILGISQQGFRIVEGDYVNWFEWVMMIFAFWFMIAAAFVALHHERTKRSAWGKHLSANIFAIASMGLILAATFSDHKTKWVYFAIAIVLLLLLAFLICWSGMRWPYFFIPIIVVLSMVLYVLWWIIGPSGTWGHGVNLTVESWLYFGTDVLFVDALGLILIFAYMGVNKVGYANRKHLKYRDSDQGKKEMEEKRKLKEKRREKENQGSA